MSMAEHNQSRTSQNLYSKQITVQRQQVKEILSPSEQKF